MANELEILTENAAGTSWVDLIPGAVSTGYQAQNTNIEANRNGIDASYVRYDSGTDEIVIDPSGPIEVNGVPFSVKSEIRLANPGAGTWYLKVVAGADDTLKSIVTQSSKGSWVAAENGLYDTGDRVLNWVLQGDSTGQTVSKIMPIEKGFVNTNGYFMDLSDLVWIPSESIKENFATPAGAVEGLAYDSSTGNLISCDDGTNLIYIHDGVTSSILSSFASPGVTPQGLAYDESSGNLISCNTGGTIYIHDGVTSSILSSFASPGSSPYGLVVDKSTGNLISSDFGTELIYIHSGLTSTISSSFTAPGLSVRGLAYDESSGNLISCDLDDDKIYIHDGVSESILTNISTPSTLPLGLTINKLTNNLISCDDGTNLIYIHRKQLFNMS